jgi:hypothetical protein
MVVGMSKDDATPEIEITPEMIEAGVSAYLEFDPVNYGIGTICAAIYARMGLAALAKYPKSSSPARKVQ